MKYTSGVFVVSTSEEVKVNLVNTDTIARNFRVVIWQILNNTPRTVLLDSGTTQLAAEQGFHVDLLPLSTATDVEVDITVDSDKVVPTLSVLPTGNGLPRYWQAPAQFKRLGE